VADLVDMDEESDGEQGHGGSMRERGEESRAKLYVLLEADRWVVTGAILGVVFAFFVAVATVAPVPLRTLVSQSDPLSTLFQALVTSIITGVTLVVTITQLVISQELGPLGDQRERMEGTMSFRTDAEAVIDDPVSPLEPSRFVQELIEATQDRARRLESAVGDGLDPQGTSRIRSFVDALTDDTSAVAEQLEGAQFGTFDVLSAALDFNYSVKIYDARRLQQEHGDALSEAATAALDDVVEVLSMFAPAREHVKTLYFQWELTNLSREILYATVPALLVAMASLVFLDTTGTIQGATLGVDNMVWLASVAVTAAVAPFAHLISYVLRIMTIAKRTLAIGPFVLRDIDRSGGVDWDDRD